MSKAVHKGISNKTIPKDIVNDARSFLVSLSFFRFFLWLQRKKERFRVHQQKYWFPSALDTYTPIHSIAFSTERSKEQGNDPMKELAAPMKRNGKN